MSKLHFRCLLAACFTLSCASVKPRVEYGIGLGLSLDYGTASLYYSNGSTIDIAKIEGNPAYKSMMRSPDVLNNDVISYYSSTADSSNPAIEAIQPPISQASLRDHLPAWLGGTSPKTHSLSLMIHALNTAAVSYLSAPTTTLEVVTPFPASPSFIDNLCSVCSSLSLQMPLSSQSPGGILAARARGIGGHCPSNIAGDPSSYQNQDPDDPEQLIFTMDYSRAALTALLVHEECGVFEKRRVLHDTNLGTDNLVTRGEDSREKLAKALREITDLPLKDGNGAGVKYISELVFMGESATDRQLQDVLREVLGEQYERVVSSERHTETVDPVFAAAQGVAYDCWDRLSFEDVPHHMELR